MPPGWAEPLAWTAYAAAAVGALGYFWIWIRRPKAIRIFNNAGLFFTSLALAGLPPILKDDPDSERFALYALISLIIAVVAQLFAGFRERRRRGRQWDGVDRRGE